MWRDRPRSFAGRTRSRTIVGVSSTSAQRNVAEIRLNRLLNRPLEDPFQTEETSLDDPVRLTSAAALEPYLGNPFAFDVFRDFMTADFRAAPDPGRSPA